MQAEFPEQALDPVNPDMHAVRGQVLLKSFGLVCFPRALMGGLNFYLQESIFPCSLQGRAVTPGMIPAGGHNENTAK